MVVASRRGSMPELIDDTRTGFLVNDVDEAVLAVSRAAEPGSTWASGRPAVAAGFIGALAVETGRSSEVRAPGIAVRWKGLGTPLAR
jgi:hypothetical protein